MLDMHQIDKLFRRMSSLHASLGTVRSAFQHLLQAQTDDDTEESRSNLDRKWKDMQLHWRVQITLVHRPLILCLSLACAIGQLVRVPTSSA